MSWSTAYWLTIGLIFSATIGIFLWNRWLRQQAKGPKKPAYTISRINGLSLNMGSAYPGGGTIALLWEHIQCTE